MTAIMLEGGLWRIEHNGVEGPTSPYERPAFWPDEENPEVIGVTAYYGENKFYRIHSEISKMDVNWKDESGK